MQYLDRIQERLAQMENENPSEHNYEQGYFKQKRDDILFFLRRETLVIDWHTKLKDIVDPASYAAAKRLAKGERERKSIFSEDAIRCADILRTSAETAYSVIKTTT